MMKKLLITTLALAGLSNINAANVTGNVKFSVVVPEIIVLYHWDEAKLNLTTTNGGFVYQDTTPAVHDGSAAIGAGSYDINGAVATSPDPLSTTGKILVKLVDSWAVRSIANNNPTLTLNVPGATLKNTANADTLSISDAELHCVATVCPSGNATSVATVSKKWAAQKGDIWFKIDLSTIGSAGTYASTISGQETFTLTFATTP